MYYWRSTEARFAPYHLHTHTHTRAASAIHIHILTQHGGALRTLPLTYTPVNSRHKCYYFPSPNILNSIIRKRRTLYLSPWCVSSASFFFLIYQSPWWASIRLKYFSSSLSHNMPDPTHERGGGQLAEQVVIKKQVPVSTMSVSPSLPTKLRSGLSASALVSPCVIFPSFELIFWSFFNFF